jgi:steroid 5-alpha reductase family enzyme
MITLFLNCLLIVIVYATIWFGISVYKNRNDIADIAWGLGYILICLFLFLTNENSILAIIVYSMICFWGVRLSVHIYRRNSKKNEDFRYKKWRDEWGKHFFLRSYFQVYLLQAMFLLVIISPVFLLATTPNATISSISVFGMLIWSIGFFFQAVGDYQLSQFVKTTESEVLKTGLWKYSRHPNYFGEILMWWGVFIAVLPLENSIYFIISPATISFLLIYVSGVPMLESKQKNNPAYQQYAKETNVLFPWPPKKT